MNCQGLPTRVVCVERYEHWNKCPQHIYTGQEVTFHGFGNMLSMCDHDKFFRLYLNGELIAHCSYNDPKYAEIEDLANSLFRGSRPMVFVNEESVKHMSNIIENNWWIGRK